MFAFLIAFLWHPKPPTDLFPPPVQPDRVVAVRMSPASASDWERIPPIDGFVVMDPDQGARPVSRTSVRLAFDDDHLFVRFEVSQTEGVRVQNLLRDFNESQNDFVGFAIDGFLDQRKRSPGVQIRGGMRLTHADARNNAGMLLIDQEGSRVAVGRYSRSFPDEARLGVMGTYLDGGAASNATATVDGQVRPTATTLIRGMVSGSTDQSAGDGWASQAWFSYRSNLLYAGMLTYAVSNYRPALGVERFGRDYVMLSPAFYFDLTRHPFPSWVRRYRPALLGIPTLVLHPSRVQRKSHQRYHPTTSHLQNRTASCLLRSHPCR